MENSKIIEEGLNDVRNNSLLLSNDSNVSKVCDSNVKQSDQFYLLFGLLNIRSINSKVDQIYELICDGLDIFVLTESWHGSSDDISLKLAMPPGFRFVDYVRPHDPFHGGIVVYFRSHFKYVRIELPSFKTFELIVLKLHINKVDLILIAIYRPGSAPLCSFFFKSLLLSRITSQH